MACNLYHNIDSENYHSLWVYQSSIQKIIKQPLSALFELRALMTSLKVKIQIQNYRSAPQVIKS